MSPTPAKRQSQRQAVPIRLRRLADAAPSIVTEEFSGPLRWGWDSGTILRRGVASGAGETDRGAESGRQRLPAACGRLYEEKSPGDLTAHDLLLTAVPMIRKTVTLFSLIGLLLSVGLWGGELLEPRPHKLQACHERRPRWVRVYKCLSTFVILFYANKARRFHRDAAFQPLVLLWFRRMADRMAARVLSLPAAHLCTAVDADGFLRRNVRILPTASNPSPPRAQEARPVHQMRIRSSRIEGQMSRMWGRV